MKTMVYRLSADGFESQHQSYHMNNMESGLNSFEKKLRFHPEHLRENIKNIYKSLLPQWKEYTNGVFVFLEKMPDKETLKFLTNHFNEKQKTEYVWWSGEISHEQYAFNPCKIWREEGFKTVKELVEKSYDEIYIPEQFLKIENIQKWTNDYRSVNHQIEEILTLNSTENEASTKRRKIR